jgi:hypothetical protein
MKKEIHRSQSGPTRGTAYDESRAQDGQMNQASPGIFRGVDLGQAQVLLKCTLEEEGTDFF